MIAGVGVGLSRFGSDREKEGVSGGDKPLAANTDTGTLQMPKMALADWEVCQVDGMSALVGTVQIDGRNQPIMLVNSNRMWSVDYFSQLHAEFANERLAEQVLKVLNSNPIGQFSGRATIKYRNDEGGVESLKLGSGGQFTNGESTGEGFLKRKDGFPLYRISPDAATNLRNQNNKEAPATPGKKENDTTEGESAEKIMDKLAIEMAIEATAKKSGLTKEQLMEELRSLPDSEKEKFRSSLQAPSKK